MMNAECEMKMENIKCGCSCIFANKKREGSLLATLSIFVFNFPFSIVNSFYAALGSASP